MISWIVQSRRFSELINTRVFRILGAFRSGNSEIYLGRMALLSVQYLFDGSSYRIANFLTPPSKGIHTVSGSKEARYPSELSCTFEAFYSYMDHSSVRLIIYISLSGSTSN